jgi:DNA-binding LacI/PurR family transcriptional regulator
MKTDADKTNYLESCGPKARVIYNSLNHDIDTGIFERGGKLPTEMALCKRYNVSRSCLRQALKVLEQEGILYSRQGSGSYISDNPRKTEPLSIISAMHHGDIGEIQDLQQMILEEGCIMSLFSQRHEGWEPALEKLFLDQVLKQQHKGLLASCTPLQPTNDQLLKELQQNSIRVVHIEPYRTELPEQAYIMPDYRRAGYAAAVHLMLCGYKTYYFYHEAKGSYNAPYLQLLKSGFESAMTDHKREFSYIDNDDFESSFMKVQNDAACGIFSAVYQPALALKQQLLEAGYDDVQKTGLLAIELAGDGVKEDDELDYIHFDRKAALKRAIAMITDPAGSAANELVPPIFISGKSTNN